MDDGSGLEPRTPRAELFDEEVYAWRQDTSSGSSPTLWIARAVIETHKASHVVRELDRLGVADRMRSHPKARFMVTQEAGQIVVENLATLRIVLPTSAGGDRGSRGGRVVTAERDGPRLSRGCTPRRRRRDRYRQSSTKTRTSTSLPERAVAAGGRWRRRREGWRGGKQPDA